jgi:hypothetical protein
MSALVGIGKVLVAAIMAVLLPLNVLSGLVAGIWLAILGEWKSIVGGILAAIIMPLAWIIAALPDLGLLLLVKRFAQYGRVFRTWLFALMSSGYNNCLIMLWTFYIFSAFIDRGKPGRYVAFVLWGYSIAQAPLAFMAQKDRPDPDSKAASALGKIISQIGYLILTACWALGMPICVPLLLALILGFSLISSILMALAIRKQRVDTDAFSAEWGPKAVPHI